MAMIMCSYTPDEEEELGALIYRSSRTARAFAAAEEEAVSTLTVLKQDPTLLTKSLVKEAPISTLTCGVVSDSTSYDIRLPPKKRSLRPNDLSLAISSKNSEVSTNNLANTPKNGNAPAKKRRRCAGICKTEGCTKFIQSRG